MKILSLKNQSQMHAPLFFSFKYRQSALLGMYPKRTYYLNFQIYPIFPSPIPTWQSRDLRYFPTTNSFFDNFGQGLFPFRDELKRDKYMLSFLIYLVQVEVTEEEWIGISFSTVNGSELISFNELHFLMQAGWDCSCYLDLNLTKYLTWLGCHSQQKELNLTKSNLQYEDCFYNSSLFRRQKLSPLIYFLL